eukprot:1973190-Ditylum_brightwellii.AAC.1
MGITEFANFILCELLNRHRNRIWAGAIWLRIGLECERNGLARDFAKRSVKKVLVVVKQLNEVLVLTDGKVSALPHSISVIKLFICVGGDGRSILPEERSLNGLWKGLFGGMKGGYVERGRLDVTAALHSEGDIVPGDKLLSEVKLKPK